VCAAFYFKMLLKYMIEKFFLVMPDIHSEYSKQIEKSIIRKSTKGKK
jgi:hypothetical protein